VFRIVPHSQKSRKNFLVFFGTFCGTQKSEKAISVVALTLFRFWGLMSGNNVKDRKVIPSGTGGDLFMLYL
jgi:hypothetical protein